MAGSGTTDPPAWAAGAADWLALETQGDVLTATLRRPLPLTLGLISDTHLSGRGRALPPAALAALAGSDLILHAGDLVALAVLTALAQIAPTLAVHGNVDPPEVRSRLPARLLLSAGRWRVGLVHGHTGIAHGHRGDGPTPARARAAFAADAVDSIVFGHSHQPLCAWRDGLLLVNPGSPTERRTSPHRTCGRLRLDEGGIDGAIIILE